MSPEPVIKHYVALDKIGRVIGHHDVNQHGAYTTDSLKDITDEHPSSTVKSFTTDAVAAVFGCVLGEDGQTASRHDDDPELDTIETRRAELLRWAEVEYPKAVQHQNGVSTGLNSDDRLLNRLVNAFRGFVYHTLWLATNPVNLDDPKWSLLKNNIRTWHNFTKFLSPDNVRGIDQNNDDFYNGFIVWIWNEVDENNLLKVRNGLGEAVATVVSTLDADAIPEFGLTSERLEVRKLLNLNIPFESHSADVSALTVSDQDDNDILLVPTFDSDVLVYTVEVGRTVTSITVSPTTFSNFASVEVDGDLSLVTLPQVFTIHVISEDREVEKTYTLTVSRSS